MTVTDPRQPDCPIVFANRAFLEMTGYTRDQVDTEFARMEEIVAASRNRAWLPVLTKAAAKGPVFAAFGALHLSGQDGVLNLLQKEGFTLEELKL